jgi:hypothetical protein
VEDKGSLGQLHSVRSDRGLIRPPIRCVSSFDPYDRDTYPQSLVGGIAYTVLTIKAAHFAEFPRFIGVIIGWVSSSILCDLVITATLTMILVRSVQQGI